MMKKPTMPKQQQQKLLYCTNDDPNISIQKFVERQKELLDMELQEQEKELEGESSSTSSSAKHDEEYRATFSLHQLQVSEVCVGLYGRTVVTLVSLSGTGLLPAHKLTVGDDVEIHGRAPQVDDNEEEGRKKNKQTARGVLHQVTETSISIALSSGKMINKHTNADHTFVGLPFSSEGPISVIPSSSVEVHRKMKASLEELFKEGTNHPIAKNVILKMFTSSKCNTSTKNTTTNICYEPFNSSLDASQLEAIRFALASQDVALIHGPPGTGKTTAVVELIQQAVHHHKWKILVCAPSNVAVDNILDRLVASSEAKRNIRNSGGKATPVRLQVVRLGHPARLSPKALAHSLEALVHAADGTEIVNDCKQELTRYIRMLTDSNNKSVVISYDQRKKAKSEIRLLQKEIRTREEKVVDQLVQQRNVILATNVGASARVLNNVEFDLVIIDEAAQALEASCWIPILRGRRLVLVGDHKQLPPTIMSKRASAALGYTMFDRAMASHDDISRMLSVQYRMHKDISDWASKEMYDGKLVPAKSVADRKLRDLSYVKKEEGDEITSTTILLIDTAGCDMEEAVTSSGSRLNQGEASVVLNHVEQLLRAGLRVTDIAIITPYNGQVELLRCMLLPKHPQLEIRSVDGFQGCEREAVVLSLVRSNTKGEVGFLADDRRLNVAITRARRHCAVVCDTETVSKHRFLKDLVKWIEDHGDYRSALEFTAAASFSVSSPLSSVHNGLIENSIPVQPRKKDKNCKADVLSTSIPSQHIDKSISLPLKEDQSKTVAITTCSASLSMEVIAEGVECHTADNEAAESRVADLNVESPTNHPSLPSSPSLLVSETLPLISKLDDGKDSAPIVEKTISQILQEVSKERMQRQNALLEEKRRDAAKKSLSKKKKPIPKGKKLGGESKPKHAEIDKCDALDDMEFLNQEVAKIQSSHGRKIEGTGSNYRTVVNGILLTKPNAQLKTSKDHNKLSLALKEKLATAETKRMGKAGRPSGPS